MNTTVIERRVSLNSKLLDKNIRQHLLDKIRTITKEECNKTYGHILNINKILEISSHEINRINSDSIFTIKFEAETLKPDPDTTLTGEVCMVYKDGVFISVLNKQKVLIPRMYLENYSFNDVLSIYENKDSSIKEGDEVTIKITASQYNNSGFSCFGSIV